jgi:CYTH domain-containing protein
VRVERGQAALILRSNTPDGQVGEEAVEVPLSHAEALVEVAAGTVAFDRTAITLGRGMEGVLDRYILPEGLDLLSVTITGDVRLFAPPLWLGREVTSDEAFEARELAINGLPAVEEVEVTNAALEALLDTLEMRGLRPSRAPDPRRASRMPAPPTPPPAATPVLDTSVRPAPQVSFSPQQHTSPLAAETGTTKVRPHSHQLSRMRVPDFRVPWMHPPRLFWTETLRTTVSQAAEARQRLSSCLRQQARRQARPKLR